KKPLNNIAGLSWKNDGRRTHNVDRKVEPLDALPIPAFDLTNIDAYEKLCGIRKLAYATSVGCPYACNYCTDQVFYKRRFNALSAERVDEMYETARKAQLGGIRVTFNLIFGYPGETEADRIVTFQTMSDIGRQFSNVSFSPNIFTPYPGITIWPQLREMGVPEPKNLREWMDMPLGANMLPWLKGRELARLQRMLNYFLLNNQIDRRHKNHYWLRRTVRFIVQSLIRWRLRYSRYSFPWKLWLSNLSTR